MELDLFSEMKKMNKFKLIEEMLIIVFLLIINQKGLIVMKAKILQVYLVTVLDLIII